MTEREMLVGLVKFARESLIDYNRKVLVDLEFDILDLPTEPYDLYKTISKVGMSFERLLLEAEVALAAFDANVELTHV